VRQSGQRLQLKTVGRHPRRGDRTSLRENGGRPAAELFIPVPTPFAVRRPRRNRIVTIRASDGTRLREARVKEEGLTQQFTVFGIEVAGWNGGLAGRTYFSLHWARVRF